MKLVICEKNIAARRIANILSGGKARSRRIGNIPVYEFTKNNEPWGIIGLKGHIVNLDFPSGFNQWTKTALQDLIHVEPCKKIKEKSIASAMQTFADKNPDLIVATDFDREGELIGVEAIDLIKQRNQKITKIDRAKFSALTNYEVTKAFDKLVDVDYNLSNAGEARQIIDLVWGAVLTRFISLTSNRLGKEFLSIGRVQSPTLAILVDREKEIKNFVPEPFWQIIATLKKDKLFSAIHVENKFWDEDEANSIYGKVKNSKTGTVKEIKKTISKELPPSPFNTTSFLQSASALGFSTATAMQIAEELYMYGLTSYPRTDNTVYPKTLGIKSIAQRLLKSRFSKEAEEVVKNGRATPTRGKKYSSDHPPIHPVGVPTANQLNSNQEKIYELICRRFLATLAKDAISETSELSIDINGEEFKASGYRLIEPNWKNIYTYFREKRKAIPELKEGEKIDVNKIILKEDTTKPPSRYTQGSLIAKMEELSLGTKSTRHEIISKLYSRKYVTGSPPVPTATGFAVTDAIENYNISKPDMTAQLEKDMDLISEGKKTLKDTVGNSRKMLVQVMKSLEKDKESIRLKIKDALREQKLIGKCPNCGHDMVIRSSKKGKRFVGCTNYPKCENTYSLPQKGSVMKTDKICAKCNTPIVKVKMTGRKYWYLCLNSNCPGKKK
jgi:DNA topoisomerase-1